MGLVSYNKSVTASVKSSRQIPWPLLEQKVNDIAKTQSTAMKENNTVLKEMIVYATKLLRNEVRNENDIPIEVLKLIDSGTKETKKLAQFDWAHNSVSSILCSRNFAVCYGY